MKTFTYQPRILTGKSVGDTLANTVRATKATSSWNRTRDKGTAMTRPSSSDSIASVNLERS
jgi:hypothetical protein